MKQKFTYIVGTIMLLVGTLLAVNPCVYASDVTHIACTSMRTGDNDIYMMEINGKNLQNLTNHLANDFSPTFSPDGRWMAYVSDKDIYLMNLATKERHWLTEGRSPDWSPDGESIVFTSSRSGQSNIYKIDVNGEAVQQLTNEASNGNPSWSPDGESIIFSSNRDPGIFLSVYVMTADGRTKKADTGEESCMVARWKTDCLYFRYCGEWRLCDERRRQKQSAVDTGKYMERESCVVARWTLDRL